ncbi:hypothetical protein [Halobellus rubicundus]|uniref:CARDB domain-containing protein n=1 Tax=Halobellus rubicundus TaxID=2996466 RepID=A0ABD5MEZ7_9EURY
MNWSSILRAVVVSSLLISGAGVAVTPAAAAPAVQMSSVTVTPDDPVTGERVSIETTISNLENSDATVRITDIYVRGRGSINEYARVEDLGSVAPGGSVTVPVSTTFETPGQKRLTVNVAVRYGGGSYERYTYPVYIDVEAPAVKADLAATNQANGTGTRVTLTNYGNTNLTDVELVASADGEEIERNFVFDLGPEASRSTVFDTDDVAAERMTVTARYAAAGESHTTTLDVDLDEAAPVLGEIRLTGVEATQTGGGLRIEGDAANLGTTDAESVLVRIPDTETVSPTAPAGEYFVGAVEGSEFATFELTASTPPNASVSSVPVEITYIVDNERVTTTQRLQIDPAPAMGFGAGQAPGGGGPGGGPSGGSGGPPLTLIGGAVAVLVVVGGIALYRWRQ